MQVSDEIFDEKYYIYYYDGDITEAIDVIQHREDINDVIQRYPHLHYVIEYYGFCNTAYAYNGNRDEMVLLFNEHPTPPPFEVIGNDLIRVKNENNIGYRDFHLSTWQWE